MKTVLFLLCVLLSASSGWRSPPSGTRDGRHGAAPRHGDENGRKKKAGLAFVLGAACGLVVFALLESVGQPLPGGEASDSRHVGLSSAWLTCGFSAQTLFMGSRLVQWIATERAKARVVPASFWWLSLVGGMKLLAYFVCRDDPVGQLFGVVIYARNLIFIGRDQRRLASAGGAA
jgi:lipid-A-disaccharide synthase-like uncharacterized protein